MRKLTILLLGLLCASVFYGQEKQEQIIPKLYIIYIDEKGFPLKCNDQFINQSDLNKISSAKIKVDDSKYKVLGFILYYTDNMGNILVEVANDGNFSEKQIKVIKQIDSGKSQYVSGIRLQDINSGKNFMFPYALEIGASCNLVEIDPLLFIEYTNKDGVKSKHKGKRIAKDDLVTAISVQAENNDVISFKLKYNDSKGNTLIASSPSNEFTSEQRAMLESIVFGKPIFISDIVLKDNTTFPYLVEVGIISKEGTEVPPSYIGGGKELFAFLSKNVKYPTESLTAGIKGVVYVQFIVDIDGRITNVEVLRGVDEYLDKEAVRVVESMPNWEPGMQDGKVVRARFTLPINFTFKDSGGNEDSNKQTKKKKNNR